MICLIKVANHSGLERKTLFLQFVFQTIFSGLFFILIGSGSSFTKSLGCLVKFLLSIFCRWEGKGLRITIPWILLRVSQVLLIQLLTADYTLTLWFVLWGDAQAQPLLMLQVKGFTPFLIDFRPFNDWEDSSVRSSMASTCRESAVEDEQEEHHTTDLCKVVGWLRGLCCLDSPHLLCLTLKGLRIMHLQFLSDFVAKTHTPQC